MRLSWAAAKPPTAALPDGIRIRELSMADEVALGGLMWDAFSGTVEGEYADPSDAGMDAAETLAGKRGPVVWCASLAAELDSVIVAAVVVVRDNAHGYLPLLAFAVTHPARQRRGIGSRLIEESIARLASSGVNELHLAVVRGNPAFGLYQRLGFQVVARQEDLTRAPRARI